MRTLLLTALFAVALCSGPSSYAKDKITYAYQLDPIFDAALYAMKTGKVSSEKVEVELSSLPIPALLQATGTRQYDVIQSDVIGVPRFAEKGLDLVIMSTAIRYMAPAEGLIIWVPKTSTVKSIDDLKGKKIAAASLGSAGFNMIRFILGEKFHVKAQPIGGDFQWVELPNPSMISAVEAGQVDAALLSLNQAYVAHQNVNLREALRPGRDMYETWKLHMVSSVNLGYADKLKARPEAFREFANLLKGSVDYMRSHQDEVFAAVAAEDHADPAFFRVVFTQYADSPGRLSDEDVRAIEKLWSLAKDAGMLTAQPDPSRFFWAGAPRE